MNKKELKALALEDLKRSGLTNQDFLKMKLMTCDDNQASAVLNSNFCTFGYVLPYFDSDGKPTEFMRFKFLEELKNDKNKVVKYSQPKGTANRLYFPPCVKWKSILKDPKQPIYFTEGEKKAYKATKEGFYTIGLGGVWSFKNKKQGKALIDDFRDINLVGRKIYLCFDNDSQSNEDVMKALRAFAKELYVQGAEVYNKILPFDPYKKIGMDDYLVENSKKDFENLPAEEFEILNVMDELNSEVAYIKNVGKFFVFDGELFVNASTLKNDVFSNRIYNDGENERNVADMWLKSVNRRMHERITYKPAQPRITDLNEYNLWKGWGRVPTKGSVKPFMDAVKKIFDNDKEIVKWFLDWVAYPIQNPGKKMLSAVLLQSVHQGTGKSSLGLCIGAMYGDNYGYITDKQLHGTFTGWAANKQFILGDEVSGKDKRSDSDFIKNLVSQEEININKKYMPDYDVPDCINYFLTSNHVDAWYLEPDDRRAFVYSIKKENGLTLQEGIKLEEFRKGKGTDHLLHYFIYEHKISKGFDHRARPPMTDAKANLIEHSLTDIERWCTHLKENADYLLTIDGVQIDRDLFTTDQVIHLYQRKNPKSTVTTTAMGKALNKVFPDVEPKVIRTVAGTLRLRPLRNFTKWAKASHKQWQDDYDKSKIALFEAKKKKHSTAGN